MSSSSEPLCEGRERATAIGSSGTRLAGARWPVTARFSARPIHSRVARACWVGVGMELSASRQDANVFRAGRPGGAAVLAPVAFQNSATPADQRVDAAASYSLISPPRIGRLL